MPRGPKGERRPADPIARAVMVGKIATGEIEDELDESRPYGRSMRGPGRPPRAESAPRSKPVSKQSSP